MVVDLIALASFAKHVYIVVGKTCSEHVVLGVASFSIPSNHRSFRKPDPFPLGFRRFSRRIPGKNGEGSTRVLDLVAVCFHCTNNIVVVSQTEHPPFQSQSSLPNVHKVVRHLLFRTPQETFLGIHGDLQREPFSGPGRQRPPILWGWTRNMFSPPKKGIRTIIFGARKDLREF